ncbi:hypothetical protein GCM10009618_22240 [Nesterenkonia lacusekhoensis]
MLLAGGGGRRLGGVDKARLRRGERTLLDHWTAELLRRDIPAVVVGPEELRADLPPQVLLTREDPPLGGPAAAVRAGMLALEQAGRLSGAEPIETEPIETEPIETGPIEAGSAETRPTAAGSAATPRILLAAVDVVDPGPLLDWLLPQLGQAGHRAVIPQDGTGRLQLLASLIPERALRARAHEITAAQTEGRPLRIMLEGIEAAHPQMPEGLGADVDTPEDAYRLDVHGHR